MSDENLNSEVAREFVTIVIPTLNEADNILRVIGSVIPCDHDFEIIVVDGGSTDGTKELVASLNDVRVRLIDNPLLIQAAGVNMAVAASDPKARYFLRADAHCDYPDGWSDMIVEYLVQTGAASVVVSMKTGSRADEPFQEAVAFSQNSRLGNGGAAHRRKVAHSHVVDHGHHAGFDKDFFRKIGGYDATFAVNEDAEYDVRVAKAGGKIWLAADAGIVYYPRKTIGALANQYFRYGVGRCRTTLKHSRQPKLRQLLPVGVTLSAIGALLGLPFCQEAAVPFVLYAVALLGYALRATPIEKGTRFAVDVAIATATMHLAWGAGFISALGTIFSQKREACR